MVPNPALYFPIEFTDKQGVVHSADSWPALAKKLTEYRKQFGQELGQPLQEIFAQVCARAPHKCKGPVERSAGNSRPLNTRILSWAMGLLRSSDKQTLNKQESAHEVARRSGICSRCPHQSPWRSACKGCSAQVTKILTKLIGKAEPDLQGCAVLGEDTAYSVHLNQPATAVPELPGFCWRR